MNADTNPAEAALWALTYLQAQDAHDAEGVAALLADVPKHIACERLAGMSAGLLVQLCIATGITPDVWAAEKRAELTGMDTR